MSSPFTRKEIDYMISLGIEANFEQPSEDDLFNIEDTIGIQVGFCFDKDGNPEPEALMCEAILDKVTALD